MNLKTASYGSDCAVVDGGEKLLRTVDMQNVCGQNDIKRAKYVRGVL